MDRSRARARALAEAAGHLPGWLPSAASLTALARSPDAAGWQRVRPDPGAVLLALRHADAVRAAPGLSFFPALLRTPFVLEEALRLLDADAPFVDWGRPAVQPVHQAALTCARWAGRLAEATGRCDPDNAWAAGLLAPLGWLAVCAAGGAAEVGACLADPELARDPAAVQRRHWGLDHAALARRLARRWGLPPWLEAVVGHLGLPLDLAQSFGAEPALFLVVQLAVHLAQRPGRPCLHLPVGATLAGAAAALGLDAQQLDALDLAEDRETGRPGDREKAAAPVSVPAGLLVSVSAGLPVSLSGDPRGVPLLRDLLAVAVENRRLHNAPAAERLEADVDALHEALERQRRAEQDNLQSRKLEALAEFAAGAGHEINNPLAVISGQAQYLLAREPEPERQKALRTIVGQAQRIHQVLRELMQFARPPRPQKQPVDVAGLVREVLTAAEESAGPRQVRLLPPEGESAVFVAADPAQLRTALNCLVRNAVEAASAAGGGRLSAISPEPTADGRPPTADGWVRVRLERPAGRVEVVVEDSGPGPTPAQREHLFDPFFSGRQAGRGRGLGLPTAWRLAREHGGDVRFVGLPDGPTRFVLSLPAGPNDGRAVA
ncbi:MAG TPA: ATP-binding protein [Gemmataceae bacterium]|nr:ATP-binding protein [Gemmataceae bacterium]